MKLKVVKLTGGTSGDIELNDAVFGVNPNKECMADVIRWQLAKRQAGTHDTKERGEINRTKKKSVKQKGSGGARHGSRNANIFVGGGVVFGPTPRSHEFKINKKVRNLALKSLLSLKIRENGLIVCDDLAVGSSKTKNLLSILSKMNLKSALFVDCNADCADFRNACSNLYKVDVMPIIGFNVYDGLSHEKIVMTRSAIVNIQDRLLG